MIYGNQFPLIAVLTISKIHIQKTAEDNIENILPKILKSLQMQELLLNRVENIVAKGEIANYEQFPPYFFTIVSNVVYSGCVKMCP